MKTKRRTLWGMACLGGLLIAAVLYSLIQLDRVRDEAGRAQVQHDTVAQAIDEINTLGGKPEIAAADTERSAQLSRHIEATAAQVGIDSDLIERVQSQPPRRIDGGPYLRQPTQVLLRQVTLLQLLALLNDLDATGQTLQVDDLRLIAPHNQLVGDHWRAEFTVSYLVYDPVETRSAVAQ